MMNIPLRGRAELVLATDLDGTFLGGSDDERRHLYDHLRDRRDEVLLVFVTGRDLPFIRDLCADGFVPFPDVVVGDVGTTVAAGPDLEPLPELEAWIAERWADRGDLVRAALADEPGIRLQPTPFRYRVSYYYDPAELRPSTLDRIRELGLDPLTSADTFLDVLPPGVSKGPTLLRLVEHLGVDADDVLVAGDTLNDLSLFETGLPGVAVGNSEPALLERIAGLDHVHLATAHGAGGITEALERRAHRRTGASS